MMTATPPNLTKRRILRLVDVGAILGVSMDTLSRRLADGSIPCIRLPSGRRAVLQEDLDAAIERWKQDAR